MVLPKSMRLKGHRCFDLLYREGKRYHQPSILLRVVKADPRLYKLKACLLESNDCRCAIAISNKVSKKAVLRNRLRRLIHEFGFKQTLQLELNPAISACADQGTPFVEKHKELKSQYHQWSGF